MVLVWCTRCFVRLSAALSPTFGGLGAGTGLSILHVNVLCSVYLGGFHGCVAGFQIVFHLVGQGVDLDLKVLLGSAVFTGAGGPPCGPVVMELGFKLCFHVVGHVDLDVFVVRVHCQ